MKAFTPIITIIIVTAILLCSCNNNSNQKKEEDSFDAEFDIMDREGNSLGLYVSCRYNLSEATFNKLEKKYGPHKEIFLIPELKPIWRNVTGEYTAGEIYSYKRKEIGLKMKSSTRRFLTSHDIEMIDLQIRSVKVPEVLMKRLEKEHFEKLKQN